jgi:hypothetical protein
MVARRLRWFGHVRTGEDEAVARVVTIEVEGRRPAGRPMKSWRKCVEEDLKRLGVDVNLALDRNRWKELIKRQTS